MTEFLVAACLVTGTLFMLLAALGALRMPDLPMRMHATTKAGALGSGLVMLAVALHYGESDVTARAIAIIVFIMLTAPVAAHVLARAGYFVGVPLWHRILADELRDKYDPATHTLSGESKKDEVEKNDHS